MDCQVCLIQLWLHTTHQLNQSPQIPSKYIGIAVCLGGFMSNKHKIQCHHLFDSLVPLLFPPMHSGCGSSSLVFPILTRTSIIPAVPQLCAYILFYTLMDSKSAIPCQQYPPPLFLPNFSVLVRTLTSRKQVVLKPVHKCHCFPSAFLYFVPRP